VATVTHRDAFSTTTGASTYTSNSFTPAAGDLLCAFVIASDSILGSPTMSDTQGIGFSLLSGAANEPMFATGIHRLYFYVSNTTAAASSMTVTFNCTGDQATGCIIFVASVAGMTATGLSAVLQSKSQQNQAAGTPAPAFSAAAQTGNVTLGCVAQASASAMTPPTSWTEQADVTYLTPSIGGEYVSRNSGFTGTTITWGSATVGNFASLIVELDTSAGGGGGGGGGARNLLLMGVG